MYTLLIAIIYLAFISLGLPDSLLGSAWPIMHSDIGVPLSAMGAVSITISTGTVLSSLLSAKLTKRFSTQTITTASVFLTAIALLGFSYSKNVAMIFIFAIPYGLGAGSIDAALNNYVALHYSSKHMSWLHCFWGVGTIISPFVMSYSLSNLNWNAGYRIISFIQIGIGIVLLLSQKLWKINETPNEAKTEEGKGLGLISAIKIRGVPQLLIAFFGYCAAEMTAMMWSTTYLVEAKGMDEEIAAAFGSLFFIGMTVGRFLGGFVMDRFGDRKMINLGTAIIVLGVALVLIPFNNEVVQLIGLVVIGLGCAPIYPCIIHSTPYNFGAENSGTIIGIQMASAYLGSTVIPPLFGPIAKLIGFEFFPLYIFCFIMLMSIMINITFKLTQLNKK